MTSGIVGQRLPKHDALQQVTGRLIYGEDLERSNMLYAKALYSRYAHAEILDIDLSEAEAMPGVVGIITSRDVPHNRFGISHNDQPVLADDKVRYKGDAIAVVAAETLELAVEAVKKIKVKYKPLPAIFDPLEGMQDQVLIHGKSNMALHVKVRSGDINEGFAAADTIIEEEYKTQKVEHCHIEPHVALAEVESDGKLVIWTSSSRPFVFATQLAKILKKPHHMLQVKIPAVGGSFGGKNEVTLEPWVALLAMKTKRPVRAAFTREEEFGVSSVRHPYQMKYKTGVTRDGRITAREIELISDSGPYVGLGKQTLTKAAIHAAGPYNIPHVKIDAYLVYCNTAVGGAMRGFGVPQVCFAYESHADSIAHKLGINPVDFRLINMFGEAGVMPTGQTINSKPLKLSLRKALELDHNHEQEGS